MIWRATFIVSFLLAIGVNAQTRGHFDLLAKYQSLGGLVATTVGPGPSPGSQRFYASYLYFENTLDVISIDPETGTAEVFHNPAKGEFGARNIALGPDGDVYLGTLAHAHFLHVDRKAHRMVDLGRPSSTEEYIWDVAFGSDGRLYGATYPGCKLVRYDPKSARLEDLGRMDPTEQYGRWIVGSSDGFMYMGIGTSKANVAVFNVKTGEHREILPTDAQVVGIAKVYHGVDGKIYAAAGTRLFRLQGSQAVEMPPGVKVTASESNILADGRSLSLSEKSGALTLTNPKTGAHQERQISYKGNDLPLFRIAFGANGGLYGSAILPIHFVEVDIQQHKVRELADLGGGEVYSFLNHEGRLLMGTYSGLAPLMSYTPGKPATLDATRGNPVLINFKDADSAWRPQAMIEGPDRRVYVGGVAGYGKLQAPLLSWDGSPGSVELHGNIEPDQSVISLANWHEFVVGGTTVKGGGGSHPTQTDAKLFLWNTKTKRKEFDIVPVPGATMITDLVTAPNGKIYGVADNVLFTFDPRNRTVVARQTLPFKEVVYNSVGIGADGRVWGLAQEGIFVIDPATNKASLVAAAPARITGGFDMHDGAIYFLCDSAIYRYWM